MNGLIVIEVLSEEFNCLFRCFDVIFLGILFEKTFKEGLRHKGVANHLRLGHAFDKGQHPHNLMIHFFFQQLFRIRQREIHILRIIDIHFLNSLTRADLKIPINLFEQGEVEIFDVIIDEIDNKVLFDALCPCIGG